MAEKSTREGPRVGSPLMTPGIALGMWGPAFTCGLKLNAMAHEGFALTTTEWQDFVGRRLKEDMSLVQRVASSKSPDEIWGAYVEFWQKAADDYGKEFATIARLSGDCLNNSVTEIQDRMEEAATEMPRLEKAA